MFILKKINNNFIFTFLLTCLLLGTDWIFSFYEIKYHFVLTPERFLGFYFFLLIISFCRSRRFLQLFFLLICFMIFTEMLHLRIYKSLISPYTYYVFLSHLNEVTDAKDYWYFMYVPIGIIIVLYSIITLLIHRFNKKKYHIKFFSYLIVFLFIWFPFRNYLLVGNFGIRPDANASLFYNSYSSLAYFLSRILPYKLVQKNSQQTNYHIVEPTKIRLQPDANIILLVGESLGYKYMSLYGYSQETTPFLKSMQNDPKFIYKKTISCGVSTNVSVPVLFNKACNLEPIAQIVAEKTCLFRLAKKNGFYTYFFSAQAADSLKGITNYYCPKYIDQFRTAYEIKGETDYYATIMDKDLLTELDQINFDDNNFIVMQQQTSHAPYYKNYPKDFKYFNEDQNDFKEHLKATYLNSIRYTDSFLADLFEYLKQHTKKPTYLIFIPDHGEAMGEEGRWGHLQLFPEQFQVPLILYTFNDDQSSILEELKTYKNFFTFNQINEITTYLLGYNQQLFTPKNHSYVIGNDIDGFDGSIQVYFEKEKITKILYQNIDY